jgi:hypothetical protein
MLRDATHVSQVSQLLEVVSKAKIPTILDMYAGVGDELI